MTRRTFLPAFAALLAVPAALAGRRRAKVEPTPMGTIVVRDGKMVRISNCRIVSLNNMCRLPANMENAFTMENCIVTHEPGAIL